MYIYVNGKEYEVKFDQMNQLEKLSELSAMDETSVFYIPIAINETNENDTLLFVNIKYRMIMPIYLGVINDMLQDKIDPVLASFQKWSIIEGDYDNYIICDANTIKSMIGVSCDEYIGIVRSMDHIAICPDINSNKQFAYFSNVKTISKR